MLPKVMTEHGSNIKIVSFPSKTYKLDPNGKKIIGWIDGVDAVEQAIYKMLSTERYEYIIYSWNYGIELADLFGEQINFVFAELEDRMKETLLVDDRIIDVDDFHFELTDKRSIHVNFRVKTLFGDRSIEREVRI